MKNVVMEKDAKQELLGDSATAAEVSDDAGVSEVAAVTKKSWNRRRIGLASTLLLVAVAAAYGGFAFTNSGQAPVSVQPAPLSNQARFSLLKAGLENGTQTALHIDSFEIDDDMLVQLEGLAELETVIVDQGKISDAGIVKFTTFPKLQLVRLRHSPITDQGMATLAECKSLWYVNLPHAACTSKGVGMLRAIPELRQLRIASPKLGNEVCREIAKIQSLRGIHLIDIAVTNEGLKSLASLPYLESLYLDNSAVTASGWRWLYANYPQIHVHVNQSHQDYDPKAHPHHD
ncbi:hypothetical protein Pla52o_19860 [Novipirellula galeiformis]|uniref:Leucine Rich repeats (2 copies) n=1 Tax=Novipirellula galeiformis TaxID=2528004 RepID=A0A5C6CGN3_9BACT|nr:hypothetical protein [Novipirellula galeiformis]TWU24063.1 hypothetical protein Pla52o_19860 [Novipirellula galeiformis]